MKHEEHQPEAGQQLRRLCSEIQLFDLCALERCSHRQGRFCTRTDLLARFEHIADEDETAPLRNAREEGDADEDGDPDDYGSDYEEDGVEEGCDEQDD